MPYDIRKALQAGKIDTEINTYITGAAVVPSAAECVIYVDLPDADVRKYVTILARIEELVNRAREEDYRRPSVSDGYWYTTLGGGKAGITFTTLNTSIVAGMVAIGIEGAGVRGSGFGSLVIDVCLKDMAGFVSGTD